MTYLVVTKDSSNRETISLQRELHIIDKICACEGEIKIYKYEGKGRFYQLIVNHIWESVGV